jgi:hypothetical protein
MLIFREKNQRTWRKTLEEKPLKQGRESTTNSTHR